MNFLLGENIDSRRWNSGQAKEFAIIHEIIASLALACINDQELQIKNQMNIYFQGKWTNRYLKEICYAFQEISPSQLTLTIQLMETLTYNNDTFQNRLYKKFPSLVKKRVKQIKKIPEFKGMINSIKI